jgi:hypothetical protein
MSDGIEEVGQDVIAIAGVLGLLSLATGGYLVSRPGIDRGLGLVAL